ncbi:HpcH/HpaI aldolase family protein [Staphylospora marina]|uniref:HpcH/HpaI aldolase family protein n=1 Tax=Staphylospora marina TaxID=2490858 RepID=UPI000F5BB63D|nr:aldolase/citrate lyase family protein [Staphylospora marina]
MRFVNKTWKSIRDGKPVFGLFCSNPSPLTVEMIGAAGYDFVILDMEHTLMSPDTLQHMIRAAESFGITPLVRIPERSPALLLQVLDAGAQGVVIPHVRGREDVEQAVENCFYPPKGTRSLNGGRNAAFGGIPLLEAMERANREVMCIPMIEDREGVENIDEILEVDGISFVLEGAADLSASYGVPWKTDHPLVKNALSHVWERADRAGVPFCAIPRNREQMSMWWNRGVRVFVLGDDRGIAYRAMKAHLEQNLSEITVIGHEQATD